MLDVCFTSENDTKRPPDQKLRVRVLAAMPRTFQNGCPSGAAWRRNASPNKSRIESVTRAQTIRAAARRKSIRMLHGIANDRRRANPGVQAAAPRLAALVTPGPQHRATAANWQTSYGNQAVLRMLQRKLTIGSSNDPLEVEADAMAEQVTKSPASPAVV